MDPIWLKLPLNVSYIWELLTVFLYKKKTTKGIWKKYALLSRQNQLVGSDNFLHTFD